MTASMCNSHSCSWSMKLTPMRHAARRSRQGFTWVSKLHAAKGSSACGVCCGHPIRCMMPDEVHSLMKQLPLRLHRRSELAAATQKRLEEAARKREEEEREKAAQRHVRREYKCARCPAFPQSRRCPAS